MASESSHRSVSASTGFAVKTVEEQLIAAIAACEEDVRRGAEDLARLKDALRSLRRQKPTSHFAGPVPHVTVQSRGSQPRKAPKRGYRDRKGSAASIIRSFVVSELRESGHPLTRSEIFDRLTRAGITIDAKEPIQRIAKVMWSSPEFVNVGDGYWLAGEPIPTAPDGTNSSEMKV